MKKTGWKDSEKYVVYVGVYMLGAMFQFQIGTSLEIVLFLSIWELELSYYYIW